MIAGLILKEDTNQNSVLSFLGDETRCEEFSTNPEIVEKIALEGPRVLAVDAGSETGREELTEKEQELKEEGHSFVPTSHEKMKKRRLKALKSLLFEEMGAESPEIIRFDPTITAKELAIDSDEALESLGVGTSNIKTAEQLDAVLGAVTARFYSQNQFKDMGVIVPEPVRSKNEDE